MKRLLLLLLLMCGAAGAMAQRTVSGIVTGTDDGLPLIGATVMIENTTKGTTTDLDGRYTLQVGDAKALIFSFVGYERQRIELSGNTLDVALRPSAAMLNEVVITGMAVKREQKSLGYAVQHVESEELTQAAVGNVATALQGKMAGVHVSQAGGAAGASQRIVIRGNSSFNNNTPLIVLDGVPMNNDEMSIITGLNKRYGMVDAGTGLSDLNTEDIASVSVLKGVSAAIYGMRAGNGVLLITTKKGNERKDGLRVSYDGSLTFDHVYCLPNFQNLYGQGVMASEYNYNKLKNEGYFANPNLSYEEFATGNWEGCRYDDNGVLMDGKYFGYGYWYVDGKGGGVNDGVDESWGPRLDIGIKLSQYNSPVVGGVRQATSWVSNPDNISDLFTTGFSQNHLFAVSNSGDRGYYRAAIGYRGQNGTMENTGIERMNATLSGSYKINNIFSFDGKMYLTHSQSDNLMSSGNSSQNPLYSTMLWSGRQIDIEDLRANYQSTTTAGDPYNWISLYHVNPFYTLYNNNTSLNRDRLMTSGALHAQATEWLRFEARVGYDSYFNTLETDILYDLNHPKGHMEISDKSNREFNADLVGYVNKKWEHFSLDGLFGANYLDYQYTYSNIASNASTGLTIPGLYTTSNIAGTPVITTDHSHIRSNSLYANAVGGWNEQVYVEMSLRGDWHSTLATPFFYPSLCGSWVMSETFPALRGKVMDYLKLRLSWANIGNATTAYATGTYYSAESLTIAGVSQYSLPATYANPNLLPENINTNEMGFESSFLDNRLRLDLCGYYRTTTDQIMAIQTAASTGYQYKMINAGNVRNIGFEAMLAADIIRQPNHGWRWTTRVNFSLDRSKVLELADGIETYFFGSYRNLGSVYARVGDSWGTIVGKAMHRNDNGEIVVGADGLPLIDENQPIGYIEPDWLMGWSNEVSYHSFSFGFLLDFRHGGDFLSSTQYASIFSGINQLTVENNVRQDGVIYGTNLLTEYTFVNEDGTANTTVVDPRKAFNYYTGISELNVIDGSYLKLRELHITYQLPHKWVAKLKLQEAKVSLVANNVAILWLHSSNFTHIDPENSMGTSLSLMGFETGYCPPSRSIGIKLNLLF